MIELEFHDYLGYLQKTIEQVKAKETELRNEECKDEADIEKVKINVYEIFQTLYHATEKKINMKKEKDVLLDEREAFQKEYLETFERIPMNWKSNYEKAKERNLYRECLIEETKLGIAWELRKLFISYLNFK